MTTVTLDTAVLDRIVRESGAKVGDILQKIAQDTEADIKMNFSQTAPAPSAPGEPPAVQTGNLKNSIIAEPEGNDWTVHDGVPHGVHQEYGTQWMAARPFMMPAVLRTVQRAPADMLKLVED